MYDRRTSSFALVTSAAVLFIAACGGDEAQSSTSSTSASTSSTGGSAASSSETASASSTGGNDATGGTVDVGGGGASAGGGDGGGDDDPGDPDDPTDPADPLDPENPPDDPDPQDDPAKAVFTVGTWNANYNNTPPAVIAHIKEIDADVIGLQEMGSPQHAKTIVSGVTECPSCAYAAYFPQADNAHACPILYKKAKFKRLDAGSFKVNDAKKVNDGGSREDLLVKSTVWVKLQDKATGVQFFLSNNHLVPSVELAGKPFPGRAERLAMFAQHMDGIVTTIKKANAEKIPIFVTGDFNVNYRKDKEAQSPVFPYARFKPLDVYANWFHLGAPQGQGTHGMRLIDYVHVTKSKKVEPLSQAILAKGGSDHNAVRMKVRLTL